MSRANDETLAASINPAESIPQILGRYKIRKLLGQGAMGMVYLAHDTQLDREIALKIPKATVDDPRYVERFFREARAAAALRHPNICPVYDVGDTDGTRYIAMAYIPGESLASLVGPGKPMPEREAASVIRKLALALATAHRNGIVHRDLKPGNVMMDEHGEPVIMDFGLARHFDSKDAETLTQVGVIMGSPAYMAPEQIEGDAELMGPHSDIYSLGVVFYELLTGMRPFQGSVTSTITQIVTKTPKKPSELRPGLDWRLESVCLKMMAKEINDRFPSMTHVAQELAEFREGHKDESDSGPLIRQAPMIAAPVPSTSQEPLFPDGDEFIPLKEDGDDPAGSSDTSKVAAARTAKPPRPEPARPRSRPEDVDTKIRQLGHRAEEIRLLVKQRQYSTAIRLLEKMVALEDPRFAKYVKWAKSSLPAVVARHHKKRSDG